MWSAMGRSCSINQRQPDDRNRREGDEPNRPGAAGQGLPARGCRPGAAGQGLPARGCGQAPARLPARGCRPGAAGQGLPARGCRPGAAGQGLPARGWPGVRPGVPARGCRPGAAARGCRPGAAGQGLPARGCRPGAAGQGLPARGCRPGAAARQAAPPQATGRAGRGFRIRAAATYPAVPRVCHKRDPITARSASGPPQPSALRTRTQPGVGGIRQRPFRAAR